MAHTVRGISTGTAKRHAGTLNSQAFHLESSRNRKGLQPKIKLARLCFLSNDKVNQTSTTLPSFRVSHPRYQLAISAYPLVSRLLGPLSDDDDDAATTVSVRLMLHQMACLIDLPAAAQRVF
ncbi:hypothetical protein OPV22_021949 [Ensete ventricosum]|uniref:Uncharacterized protein n=1 Tax=Ensete ventricosum TaxID=4639 RepID=A0AAV8QRT4_ENSVE|nr:hypothetical protein OPV22_021949 [Ensete ventricosum]